MESIICAQAVQHRSCRVNALDEFILRKQGRTWDGVPMSHVKFGDFESDAFKAFRRKAIASARLTARDLEITDEMLLKNLRLVEGDYLKRAAILLFHQDEIHGPLITMADKAEDLAYLKYFKGIISYEGLQRIETYPIPRQAFREALLNAIIHRDYSTGNPIHIHIYPDKILIYNDGRLPESWTADDLFSPHTSKPYNPLIAGAFFRSGQIEAWGRGIEKITETCKSWGKPLPFFRLRPNEVMIGFNTESQFGEKFGVNQTQEKIMAIMRSNPALSINAIAGEIGITTRGVEKSIRELKKAGIVDRRGAAKGGYWVVKL